MNKLTRAQEEYFKNSSIKDNKGNLIVLYHGTNVEFDSFSNIKTEPGYWFSEDPSYANEHGKIVLEVYLNITNPFNMDDFEMTDVHYTKFFADRNFDEKLILSNEFKNYLQEEGFDGMMWEHSGYNTIIAFEPNQIKAIDNLYPTNSNNFIDNSEEYFKKHNNRNKGFER